MYDDIRKRRLDESLPEDNTGTEDYGLPGSTCPDFGKHDSG